MGKTTEQAMPYAVDLHTHSVASPDGSLTLDDYRELLQSNRLQYIAVTDHDTVDMALQLQAELGDHIIVGEEISTGEGEIIGLYLSKTIAPTASVSQAVKEIQAQGGLVYIPHPFETVRHGVTVKTLLHIAREVDIIEVHNGRAIFQNFAHEALAWAKANNVAGAASSDAHGRIGWGRTYSIIEQVPTRENLVGQLSFARLNRGFVGARGILYPKVNRIRKKFNGA